MAGIVFRTQAWVWKVLVHWGWAWGRIAMGSAEVVVFGPRRVASASRWSFVLPKGSESQWGAVCPKLRSEVARCCLPTKPRSWQFLSDPFSRDHFGHADQKLLYDLLGQSRPWEMAFRHRSNLHTRLASTSWSSKGNVTRNSVAYLILIFTAFHSSQWQAVLAAESGKARRL